MAYGTYMPNPNGYGYGNQYFAQPMQSMPMQNMQQPQMQPMQNMQRVPELQGRVVDSIDTVKGIEIPLNRFCFLFSVSR